MSDHGFFQITQKAFIRKGDLLLVMRDKKSGEGDLPGGRMNQNEFFENWIDSLKRELEEELGTSMKLKISEDVVLIHKHRVNLGNYPCVILGYDCEYISGEINISEEHDFFEWVDIKTFKAETFYSEYMLEAVSKYLSRFK
jgi:8-oxo-dGTP pyrophosphatase MutT (NUDIX family)